MEGSPFARPPAPARAITTCSCKRPWPHQRKTSHQHTNALRHEPPEQHNEPHCGQQPARLDAAQTSCAHYRKARQHTTAQPRLADTHHHCTIAAEQHHQPRKQRKQARTTRQKPTSSKNSVQGSGPQQHSVESTAAPHARAVEEPSYIFLPLTAVRVAGRVLRALARLWRVSRCHHH